jgi:alkylation response protein AidB-like acyl-CoA dehydrogenase
MEDTGLPEIMRDQFVNGIWEGTTNVLSQDVLRVLGRVSDALKLFVEDITNRIVEVRL